MEACWAHNPEVRRSKLRSAKFFFQNKKSLINILAKIISSIYFKLKFLISKVILSGWPSGLRRQTQGTCLTPMIRSCRENSGPRMRAWVQIPLLTATFWKSLLMSLGNCSRMKFPVKKVCQCLYL